MAKPRLTRLQKYTLDMRRLQDQIYVLNSNLLDIMSHYRMTESQETSYPPFDEKEELVREGTVWNQISCFLGFHTWYSPEEKYSGVTPTILDDGSAMYKNDDAVVVEQTCKHCSKVKTLVKE